VYSSCSSTRNWFIFASIFRCLCVRIILRALQRHDACSPSLTRGIQYFPDERCKVFQRRILYFSYQMLYEPFVYRVWPFPLHTKSKLRCVFTDVRYSRLLMYYWHILIVLLPCTTVCSLKLCRGIFGSVRWSDRLAYMQFNGREPCVRTLATTMDGMGCTMKADTQHCLYI
jgi:hypothetical protein